MTGQTDELQSTPLLSSSSPRARLGVILIICSCWLFSGMHVGVRYASDRLGLDPIFLTFARGFIQFTILSVVLLLCYLHGSISLPAENAALFMFLRGLLGSLAMVSKYASLARLPVGIAASLFSTTPLFAAFFGFILVNEKLSYSDLISMAVCLSGGLLLGIPDGPMKLDGHLLGVMLAVSGAATTALVFVTIRGIGTRVHFFFSVLSLAIGAMFTPFVIRVYQLGDVGDAWAHIVENFQLATSTREGLLAVASVGCFSSAAALCLNRALQLLGAGKASIIRTLEIPFGFLTAYIVMGELPHAMGQFIGCALITAGIIINLTGKGKS